MLRRDRRRQRTVAVAASRKAVEPAAERAHHPADMLADDIVADADLAQLPSMSSMKISVSSTDGSRPASPSRLQPEQDQREHRRDHVEAAVDRVRHPPSRYQAGSRPAATIAAVERLRAASRCGVAPKMR